MKRFGPRSAKKGFIIVPLVLVVAAALSAIVMLLWNSILVPATNVNQINIWQAAGLLLLSRILFGGFGPRRWGRRQGPPRRWKEKWRNMSDEERQQLRQRWKDRCDTREGE